MEINPFFSIVEEVEPQLPSVVENEPETENEQEQENAQPEKPVKAPLLKAKSEPLVVKNRQNARQIKILEEEERRRRVAQLKEQRRLEKERKLQESEENKFDFLLSPYFHSFFKLVL